jgi:hypothetical protein
VSDAPKNDVPVLGQEASKLPFEFPWHEIRDFLSIHISRKMAEQNMMVGEKMLEMKDPNASKEAVANVRKMHDQLQNIEIALNAKIEAKLTAIEGRGPRLILPH